MVLAADSLDTSRLVSDEERQQMVRMRDEGLGVREIARRLNRAPSTVSRTLRAIAPAAGPAPARPARAAVAPAEKPSARRGAPRTLVAPRRGPVTRQELRGLERRVDRIERSLTRLAKLLAPPTRARRRR